MIVEIKKKLFYESLMMALADREDYELAAKMRDTIRDMREPDEIIKIDLDEYKKKKPR